ncbi:hypothetical protein A6R68_16520, partial [Neotoma lepida]
NYDIELLPEVQHGLCYASNDGVWDPEKWHASLYPASGRSSPVESLKKEPESDRPSLVRRIAGKCTDIYKCCGHSFWRCWFAYLSLSGIFSDPRERVKEDDLDVVLSPQRRSFGGGCHVTAAVSSRRSGSPLEKDSDGLRLLGGRRIGSGRIISARAFEKDHRLSDKDLRDLRDRDRERDYKDKRFRREFGDSKRVFGERRRNDSYTEEEPEWFSAGPTSQSETIELTGFDDKILEEDHKGRKRTRRRAASVKEGIVECNGGVAEEDEVEVILAQEPSADQEVPRDVMIEDVLGEGSVSASRFSRWFSNPSRSGSRSSSLGSTPHEELERLAGLEQAVLSPGQNSGNYFAPIPSEDHAENKVDILEMLQKAKVDLKPLLSSLSANKEKLKESSHSGVVLSVEEVEAGLKGLKVDQQVKNSTPFMAEHLEETLSAVTSNRQLKKDGDMTAFNKLVSTMKASGTLPTQPKVSRNLDSHLLAPAEIPGQPVPKNILQMSQLELQQAALEGLALPHDLAVQAASFYQPGFNKPQVDRTRDGLRSRQQRVSKSPAPMHRGNSSSPAPAASITSMLSPSFTPTSVIRKMYESREKSKEEIAPGTVVPGDAKEDSQKASEGVLPPGIDMAPLQGISGPLLGQPLYPFSAASHPLLNPRPGTPLHLAVMQQQLQRSVLHPPGSGSQAAAINVQTPQNVASRSGLPHMHSPLEHRTSQRSSSPVGLAKWFGSDVLQQPLPSMPTKVISVDELEYRQ